MYIYAETAFHHEGNVEFLYELIEEIANTSCNGIKFQVLTEATDFISSRHAAFKSLSTYCFNYKTWENIFEFASKKGLDIILMPLNVKATLLAKHQSVKFLDIHSVSFNDNNLLHAIKSVQKPIILGIGGRTNTEIENLIEFFEGRISVLMTGFQSFPSKLEDIGLGKISMLKLKYPKMKIGYADHSEFDTREAVVSNEYARILGATIFEKHITITEGREKVDSVSAVSISKLNEIIERLNFIEKYVLPGTEKSEFNQAELNYRNRQAIVVANRDLSINTTLTENDLSLKLFDGKADFFKIEDLVGKVLVSATNQDYPLLNENLA